MSRQFSREWYVEVALGKIPNASYIHKYGRNPDIDIASGFEAIWNTGGAYTGFNATAAETLEVFSGSANDAGTLVTSGTATGGSATTLEDTGATFISAGVAVGDAILDDTQHLHGVVKTVTSETVLTVEVFDSSSAVGSYTYPQVGDSYRIASPASTGLAVIDLLKMLDGNLSNESSEYIILNGITPVDTSGTYRRQSRALGIIAGSTGSNEGVITARQKTTTANVMMGIPIGYNQTMISAYTIPADGPSGRIIQFFATLTGLINASCNIRILSRHLNEVFRVEEELAIGGAATSYASREYKIPKGPLPPGTDIVIVANTDTNNTSIAAGFDLLLFD